MRSCLRLVVAAMAVATPLAANAVLIDDFSSGPYVIVANSVNPVSEAVRLGTMLGGERDALLGHINGPQNLTAIVDISGGAVQFFNAGTETTGYLLLQYDGMGEGELETDGSQTLGNSLGANFTGDDRFVFDFAFIDAGLGANVAITTTIVSSLGTSTFTSFVANGANIQHLVMFSNFANVDWGNIHSITFRFDAPPAADFTLNTIYTTSIPGPAAIVPFAVGFAALKRRRR